MVKSIPQTKSRVKKMEITKTILEESLLYSSDERY